MIEKAKRTEDAAGILRFSMGEPCAAQQKAV